MRPQLNPQEPRRKPSVELVKVASTPPVPATLGTVGADLWVALWSMAAGTYSPMSDSQVVERYCSLHERALMFRSELAVQGWVCEGSQGSLVAHPLARLLISTEAAMQPLEDRLGLSPEARVRLGLMANANRSALDEFLDEDET